MPAEAEHRKLAAIMFTDMVGYSALTQRNEALALALVAAQQRLLRPILAQHGGREVKGTGDGYLVEFASALQAVELDPLSPEINTVLGFSLTSARRYEEAIKQLRTAVAVDPDYWWAHMWLGSAYAHARRFSEAIAELRAAQKLFQSPEIESALGRVYADAGDRTKATEVLEHLRRQMKDAFVSASFLATLHIGLGQVDEALAAQAEQEHSYYVGWWKVDPELDPLRSDPRFTALLKKVGLDK